MHPRNPYAVRRPDFAALAALYPAFGAFVCSGADGRATLAWSDPQALVELARVLLKHDFGIEWTLPAQGANLCPTVPSRLNYLCWIADLLDEASIGGSQTPTAPPEIVGVDIGTGASCIYPLLGVAQFGWRFIGTEIDESSVTAARRNVGLNSWHDRIEVRHVRARLVATTTATTTEGSAAAGGDLEVGGGNTAGRGSSEREPVDRVAASLEAPILVGVLRPTESAQFCMCNPPFYDLHETPQPNLAIQPHARCEATLSEQFTDGGEVGFVLRLVADSVLLRERVLWYTSLVGRKRSLRPILASLREVREVAPLDSRTTKVAHRR